MAEQQIIANTQRPIILEQLISDLRNLGLQATDTVLVHSALSQLGWGWVCGGAATVISALQQSLSQGTLIMPTHSSQLTDPAS